MVRLFGYLFLGCAAVFVIVGLLCTFKEPSAQENNAFFYLCGGLLMVSGVMLLPAVPGPENETVDEGEASEEDGPDEDDDTLEEEDLEEELEKPEDVPTAERLRHGVDHRLRICISAMRGK